MILRLVKSKTFRRILIWGAPDFFFQCRLGIATWSWARIMRRVNWLKSKFMEKGENVHTINATIIPKTVISLHLKMVMISFSEFHWTWDETSCDFSVVALLIFMHINLLILFTKFYILSWEIARLLDVNWFVGCFFFDCEWTWPLKTLSSTRRSSRGRILLRVPRLTSFCNTCEVEVDVRREKRIYEKKNLNFPIKHSSCVSFSSNISRISLTSL